MPIWELDEGELPPLVPQNPYPFKGVVEAKDFITGDALASLIGLTAGTSMNSDAGWLKFISTDKEEFYIAKKCLRYGMSWDACNTAMDPYNKTINIKGVDYTLRWMTGVNKAVGDHLDSSAGGDWNKYIYPIYDDVDRSSLPANTPVWGHFTAVELGLAPVRQQLTNGTQTMTREKDPSGGHSLRGYSAGNLPNVMGLYYTGNTPGAPHGWRPVLVKKSTLIPLPPTPLRGEVAQANFITFDDLDTAMGLTVGNKLNRTSPWLHIVTDDGREFYWPKKSIRGSITHEQLDALGITNGKPITIGGRQFTCRLPTGLTANPGSVIGGEWKELIGALTDGTWADYTASDLATGTGGNTNGELVMVKERHSNGGWATPGYPGLMGLWYMNQNQSNNGYGYRPILQLVK